MIIIVIIILAIILGVIFGVLFSRILFKLKQKKIENDAVKKIMEQDKDYILDGKKYDLKAEIKKDLIKCGVEKIVEDEKEEVEPIKPFNLPKNRKNWTKKVNVKFKKKPTKKIKNIKGRKKKKKTLKK